MGPRTVAPLLVVALAVAASVRASDYAFGFDPRTGDAWLDARLGDINVYAEGHLDGHVDQVVLSTGAPRSLVHELVVVERYPPADVWMMGEFARLTGQPFADVRAHYDRHRGRGWGVIARELGITPGSDAFHRLKRGADGFVAARGRGGGPPDPAKGGGAVTSKNDGRGRGKPKDKDRDRR